MNARAWSRTRFALALGALAFASGCRRKAPGPEECVAFAQHVVGVRSELDLRIPGTAERVDDLTTECLLTPYDRELLACVAQGVGPRLCMREFSARNARVVTPPHSRRRRRDAPFP